MERSPVFLVHEKGINTADFLRNYLCPFMINVWARRNLYLDCNSCNHKSSHVDHVVMISDHLQDYSSPK